MEIYKIYVSNKSCDLDHVYKLLAENSSYAICEGLFVAITDKSEWLNDLGKGVSFEKVDNYDCFSGQSFIYEWIRREYLKRLYEPAKFEVQERTAMMYETLKEVEKYFEKREVADEEKNSSATEGDDNSAN